MPRDDARAAFESRGTVTARPIAAGHDQLQYRVAVSFRDAPELAAQCPGRRPRDPKPPAAGIEPLEVIIQQPNRTAPYPHGLKHPIAVLQSSISTVDSRAGPAVDPGAQGPASSARNNPSALAPVSANSCAGFESATIPAPARNLIPSAVAVMVRIKILKSQLPSRLR